MIRAVYKTRIEMKSRFFFIEIAKNGKAKAIGVLFNISSSKYKMSIYVVFVLCKCGVR